MRDLVSAYLQQFSNTSTIIAQRMKEMFPSCVQDNKTPILVVLLES